MGLIWILATLVAHLFAWHRAYRRFMRARSVVLRAEAQLRDARWHHHNADSRLRRDIRALLKLHGLSDSRFSGQMFPELAGDMLLSEGSATRDPAVQGRLRIALYRVYGAERALLEETRSLDALVHRFCMGPLVIFRADARVTTPGLRLGIALMWLVALYWVVLQRLP